MSLDRFVATVSSLSHRDRTKQVIALGQRAHAGDVDAKTLLGALTASPDAYLRLLAITACHGSRDGEAVARGFGDVSRRVRWASAALSALVCSDEQLTRVLPTIVERRLLARVLVDLVARRRQAVVDRFLTAALGNERATGGAGGSRQIADLLPYASQTVVAAHVRALAEGGSAVGWGRLSRRHGAEATRWLRDEVARSRHVEYRLRHRWLLVATELAERCPDDALSLAEELFDHGESLSSAQGMLRALVRKRPAATFDLLRRIETKALTTRVRGSFGGVSFDKYVHHLGQARLHFLLTHAFAGLSDGRRGRRWFFRLSPADRAFALTTFRDDTPGGFGGFLFAYLSIATDDDRAKRDAAFERWRLANRDSRGVIAVARLEPLPPDLRQREAHRHLDDVEALASSIDERLAYAALLPYPEAKLAVAARLAHPEGEERAKAWRVLLGALRLDPERAHLALALADVRARKFEQDPVRQAIVETLAGLPIARFAAEDLEAAGVIVGDALDAADLSHATSSAVERWVCRLFRCAGDGAGEWAATQLGKLFRVRGSVSTWALGEGLTQADVVRLGPAIERLVLAWSSKERAGSIVALAGSLGIRLRHAPAVLDALERLARELPFVHVAGAALALLRKAARPRFARLVGELLTTDPSFVLLPDVARYVALTRQDWLGPLLTGEPMTGRFATGRTQWVLDFGPGTARWTSAQQTIYAGQLVKLLSDPDRDVPTLRFAIERLSRLAFADASAILPFAADPRPPVRELALRSLPWLDARQGVPVLVDALGDDRARWAIYALRKVFAELSPEAVLATLRAVPTKKVTVAKEVVRLLGELGSPEARDELFTLAASRPPLHRDVRIALLRALWDHLDDTRTWQLLVAAVEDPDWVVASRVAELPLDRLSPKQDTLLAPLFAGVLRRPEVEARLDLLRRAQTLTLRDRERGFFRSLVDHLATSDDGEAALALSAVIQRMTNEPAEIAHVVARLSSLLAAPVRYQRAAALADTLRAQIGPYTRAAVVAVAEGFVRHLVDALPVVPAGLRLGARFWTPDGFVAALVRLSERNWLAYDPMEAALGALSGVGGASAIEAQLHPQEDPRLRRIGLAALVVAAAPLLHGWTRPHLARLAGYRADASPHVAAAAEMVNVPDERAVPPAAVAPTR
jgi:cellulose synthase operon protein C